MMISARDGGAQSQARLHRDAADRVAGIRGGGPRFDVVGSERAPLIDELEVVVPGARLPKDARADRTAALVVRALIVPGVVAAQAEEVQVEPERIAEHGPGRIRAPEPFAVIGAVVELPAIRP